MKKLLITLGMVAVIVIGVTIFVLSNSDNDPPLPPPFPPENEGVAIYIDASQSMRGFFRAGGMVGTTIQHFLWTWLQPELLAVLPKTPINFATFGNETANPTLLTTSLFKTFSFNNGDDRDRFFAETETRLVEQLQDEALKKYKAFVIITDGVPSSPNMAGPDPRIISTIQEYIIDAGLHLWMIGVQVQFAGRVYPEIPGATGRSSFRYRGVRPIYLWVGSPNSKLGADLVSRFLERLRETATKQGLSSDGIRFVELTHIEIPKVHLSLDGSGNQNILVRETDDHIVLGYSSHLTGIVQIPITMRWDKVHLPRKLDLIFEASPTTVEIDNDYNKWQLAIDPRNYSIIQLSLNATPKIEPWWDSWSTDDDSTNAHAHQTLYLSQVVNGLRKPVQTTEAGKLVIELK